ncbi:MAG: pyridine nucleotide-disulfide oxidoreductase [Marmoricola sp.]|nr:pyridine nucleotide-disulfide oxidoreductase [Marmoricola sp.]
MNTYRALRVIVIGAGAWGLPTAAELARRGHTVTLVDRYGPGNLWSSSAGPTRLWRVADPDRAATRFGRRSVDAMDRVQKHTGQTVYERQGLVWRDAPDPIARLLESIRAEEVQHIEIPAVDVGDYFPGLRSDGRDAVWLPEAGAVLASTSLSAYRTIFERHRGASDIIMGQVVGIKSVEAGVHIVLDDGRTLQADAAVLAAGPGAKNLLPSLGVTTPVQPFAEQVIHVGYPDRPSALDSLPCLFDGPSDQAAGIYAMPTPGVGYKVGLDLPLRPVDETDLDRTPNSARTATMAARARHDLSMPDVCLIDEQVCVWTDSPDGWFIVDRLDNVVIASGDSGKGFKYSALMGEILADLAEGRSADPEVSAMSLERFADRAFPVEWAPTAMGGREVL